MEMILETRGLTAGYRKGRMESPVLRNVSLTLRRGTLVSLLGANGAGKSTLLRTISGVQPPLSGEVLLGGEPISGYSPRRLSRMVSIVSTDRTQAGGLTVEELVGLGRQPHTGFLGRLDDEDRAVVRHAIESVGIAHKAKQFVAELSDGERQKTMIAKALAQEAPLIILDEPTAFLDVASRIETLQLLHRLAHEERKAVLLSSHDVAQSLALSDRLWLLGADCTIVDRTTEDAVLQGDMNRLFPGRDLCFDMTSGDFFSGLSGSRPVSISADSPELYHWAHNALRRNGYRPEAEAPLSIHVHAAAAITLRTPAATETFSSFEQLLEALADRVE